MENFKIDIPQAPAWTFIENEYITRMIDEALTPHLPMFAKMAEGEHSVYWENIHDRLDNSRARYEQLTGRLEDLYALNVGEEVTPEIRQLEKNRRPLATIIKSEAATFGQKDKYLSHALQKFDDDIKRNVAALTTRCVNEGIELDSLDVSCTAFKANSLTLRFTVDKGQGFDAVFAFSKGSSLLRMPHLRCNVSDISIRKQVDRGQPVTVAADNLGQILSERMVRILDKVYDDMVDISTVAHTAYYHNLWQKLPYARERHAALQQEIALANRMGLTGKVKSLRKVDNGFARLVNSEAAAHMTVDSYISHVRSQCKDMLDKAAETIAQKCIEKGMDDKMTKASSLQLEGNEIRLLLGDGKRQIQASMYLHADKGIQKAPHFKTSVGEVIGLKAGQQDKYAPKNSKLSLEDSMNDKNELLKRPLPPGLVTKEKIVEYNGNSYITCYIAGVRQSPQRIKPEEWQRYLAQPGNDKTGLVIAHYSAQLLQAMQGKPEDNGISNAKTFKL